MKRTKLTSAIGALAIASVLGTSAHAQTSYSTGDLLLGFEQQNGSGGVTANDLVVDLGGANNFTTTSTFTLDLPTGSGSGLVTAFGTNWASNTPAGSLVQWGVVGGSKTTGSSLTLGSETLADNTLFYTVGELTPGSGSSAPATASNGVQKNINGNIQSFAGDFGGRTQADAGVNDAVISSGDSLGWSTGASNGSPSSNGFGGTGPIEQPASGSHTGPTNSQLDLYELTPSSTPQAAVYLGDFTLSSGGVLQFNGAAAVPEPAAYSLAAVAVALFVVLRRRKTLSVQ